MQAPRTDVCNLGATAGFYMISNSKSGRPKNSSCASLFSCCHALVLKYHLVQPAAIGTAETMPDFVQGLSNVRRSERWENANMFGSSEQNQKSFWWTKWIRGFSWTRRCLLHLAAPIISRFGRCVAVRKSILTAVFPAGAWRSEREVSPCTFLTQKQEQKVPARLWTHI